MRALKSPAAWLFLLFVAASFLAGYYVTPTYTIEKISLDIQTDGNGKEYFIYKEKPKYIEDAKPISKSGLNPDKLEEINRSGVAPKISEDFVYETETIKGEEKQNYYQLIAQRHWGFWSLLPAFVAIILCWQTREPISSLAAGIICGALLMSQYDITEVVILPALGTTGAAGILILYLWMLGGLLGIWSKTGAAQAFADLITRKFVKGPRSAKLVAWSLGVIFFSGWNNEFSTRWHNSQTNCG